MENTANGALSSLVVSLVVEERRPEKGFAITPHLHMEEQIAKEHHLKLSYVIPPLARVCIRSENKY